MPCNKPLTGWKGENGKLTLSNPEGRYLQQITVPCGGCRGCRADRARDWAIRCYHESKMHDQNCVVTLTYSPENLPKDGSLHYKDFQDFMKRLRKNTGQNIRYYMCGEYGEQLQRPHYHAILFGIDFVEDRYQWRRKGKNQYFRSPTLENCWGKGNCEIGNFQPQAARYVAQYISKKITGERSEDHYQGKTPEFNKMSLKPAIGYTWFQRNRKDVFPCDDVVMEGKKYPVPRYYNDLWNNICPTGYNFLKRHRIKKAEEKHDHQTKGLDRPEKAKYSTNQRIARETILSKKQQGARNEI